MLSPLYIGQILSRQYFCRINGFAQSITDSSSSRPFCEVLCRLELETCSIRGKYLLGTEQSLSVSFGAARDLINVPIDGPVSASVTTRSRAWQIKARKLLQKSSKFDEKSLFQTKSKFISTGSCRNKLSSRSFPLFPLEEWSNNAVCSRFLRPPS